MLNLATGVVLTTVAAFDGRIGFIVLNVVWGIAAAPRVPRRAAHPDRLKTVGGPTIRIWGWSP